MRIAISGTYRCGKTFLGKALSLETEIPHFAFADIIKIKAQELVPTVDFFAEEKDTQTRDVLKSVGLILNDRQCFTTYEICRKVLETGKGIISDLRFIEELSYCQTHDFTIVYIGASSTDYDLDYIYRNADIRLPFRPNLNVRNFSYFLRDISKIKSEN